MRRLITLILTVAMFTVLVGCNSRITVTDYASVYNKELILLNDVMNNSYDLIGGHLVDFVMYDALFSKEVYENELRIYEKKLDDALYSFYQLSQQIDDTTLLTIQSEIELELETMNIELSKYLDTEVFDVIHPSRIPLYEETFVFITNIRPHLNRLYEKLHEMEDYLGKYVSEDYFDELHNKRLKSQLRTGLLYTILGVGIAPSKEHTGLQVDFRSPFYIRQDEVYMTYEMSIGILDEVQLFNTQLFETMKLHDETAFDTHNQTLFEEYMILFDETNGYNQIRRQYPYDFYISDAFKERQSGQYITLFGRKSYVMDFNEDETELLEMKDYFMDIYIKMYEPTLRSLVF